MSFPPVPKEIKPVAHLLKVATEHDTRNIVVAYWARMSAVNLALKLTPGPRSPETTELLASLLDWMEKTKKGNITNEGISSVIAAQAIIEEYALTLFNYADQQDRALVFNKDTVKAFYTCGVVMDILDQFDLTEEIIEKRKYAKWKAAYIHNCLKNGEVPLPGAPGETVVPPVEFTPEQQAFLEAEEKKMREGLERERQMSLDDPSYIPPTFPYTKPKEHSLVGPPPKPLSNIGPEPEEPPQTNSGTNLSPDKIQTAQKYCKFATSALNYDDIKTAVENLTKALNLLQGGKEE